jgi:hypothetical protein
MVSPAGVVTTLGGVSQIDVLPGAAGGEYFLSGSTDGPGNIARFNDPTTLAADVAGNIYIADTDNNVIRKGAPSAGPAAVLGVFPGDGSIGGQFTFILSGPPGQTVIVEASSDLSRWSPVWTNTFAGSLQFLDPGSATHSNRFYRVVLP